MPSLAQLIVGLLPLGYVTWLALRFGFGEALSLRSAGVAFFWVGYHLSPWLYFLTGERWDRFLLVPDHISSGLLFSTLCSSFFLVGYSRVFTYRLARFRARSTNNQEITVRPRSVVALSLLVVLSGLVSVGGVNEFWSATSHRGAAQFDQRDAVGIAVQMIAVLNTPLTIGLAIFSGFLILQRRQFHYQVALGIAGLLVAALHGMSTFSRAAGLPLIIFALLALRIRGKRALAYATAAILLALFMDSVGLNYRGSYYPGIRNYIGAAADSFSEAIKARRGEQWSQGFLNPLDAQAPFTRVVHIGAGHDQETNWLAFKLLLNLNPLPSGLVPPFEIGENLSVVMHTWGSTGITTPAFAELYRVFGQFGSIALLFVGLVCGWCEKRNVLRPSPLNLFNVMLFFAAFPIGLHSSLRAMTRPYIYGFALVVAARTTYVRRRLGYQRQLR